jgi:hypothetical protein
MTWRNLILLFSLTLGFLLIGCQEKKSITDPGTETDKEAMKTLIEEDSSLTSFDYNYNEDGFTEALGKIQETIKHFRVGVEANLVNLNVSINVQGDTAYGTITKDFEGTLMIEASYDTSATEPDTVIEKSFASTVTRNVIFVKINHTDFPRRNWVIAAISLPQGGTASPNIDIQKVTVFLPNDDTLSIESPNDFYLKRGWGWWRQIPIIRPGENVTVRVELYSGYAEDDYVSLVYGANRWCHQRGKKLFDFISSTPNGNGYDKVYEQTFTAHSIPGFFHAVINAIPRQVLDDDSAPVESETWGIPYIIKMH